MNYPNTSQLASWLKVAGLEVMSKLASFDIDDNEFAANLKEINSQHPDHTDSDAQSRAVYRILTHSQNTSVQAMSQEAAPAIPTVVRALNDGLRAQAQVIAVMSQKAEALEQAATTGYTKVVMELSTLREQNAAQFQLLTTRQGEQEHQERLQGEWLINRLDMLEAQRRVRTKRFLLAAVVALLALFAATLAKAEPDDRLHNIEATFLFHPMAQFSGVQPVNLVYNSATNPLYVSCVGGTCTGGGGGGGGTSSVFGAAFPTDGTAVGFIDSSGNMAGGTLDAGGRLITTGAGGTFPVTGTFWQATQPVSLTSTTITGTVAVTQSTSPWVISFTAPQHTIVDSGSITANAGTNLNTSALQLDATGAALDLAQGSTTSGQTGPLVQTATTTAAPSYTTAKTNPLSTDTAGNLRVAGAVTGSGNFTAVQPTGTNLHAVLDTTSTTAVTQATGTNLHAVLDTTSTTAVTQATGTNLHAVLDTTSTTAVTQATAANLNAAVVGTGTAGSAAGGVLTVQGVASMTKLLVTPDSVALPANQSVNVAQINGHTAVDVPNGVLAIGGNTATNVAITSDPVLLGAQAVSSENTAVTTARGVQLTADLVGKLIVLPYANPENYLTGVTAAITDTTSTSVIASAGGSLRNYITSCKVTNSHATVGTFVKILDGATIIDEAFAAPAGGGWSTTYAVPLRGTAATAVNCQAVTTGANFICSCQGYKGV